MDPRERPAFSTGPQLLKLHPGFFFKLQLDRGWRTVVRIPTSRVPAEMVRQLFTSQ